MSTLKPCPFCGAAEPMVFPPTAKASDPYSPWDRLYPIVRCRSCHAEVCGADGDSLCKTAIEKWNVRVAAQPAPVAWVAADTLTSPHPACVSSLAYMSVRDKDLGREYVPLYTAPMTVPDDVQLDAVKSTAAIAWGWLWHVTTADDRVKTARHLLGQMLDKDLKRYGIQNAKDEGAQVNVQEIKAVMLRTSDGGAA